MLVRQMATTVDSGDGYESYTEDDELIQVADDGGGGDGDLAPTHPATWLASQVGKMPVRQWTIDTGAISPRLGNDGGINSTAFLLRPISRNSVKSHAGGMEGHGGGRSKSPASKAALAAAIAATALKADNILHVVTSPEYLGGGGSSGRLMSSPSVNTYSNLVKRQRMMQKQTTSESAPIGLGPTLPTAASCQPSRPTKQLPRQHSDEAPVAS